MILYKLFEDEQHPVYRKLSANNLARQYGGTDSAGVDAERTR